MSRDSVLDFKRLRTHAVMYVEASQKEREEFAGAFSLFGGSEVSAKELMTVFRSLGKQCF